MRLARPSAFILAVFTAALVWAAVWQLSPLVSTQWPMVNESAHGRLASLNPAQGAARFRCDSLVAEDCFEMFHRHTPSQAAATGPFTLVLDFGNAPGAGRTEADACLPDAPHRDRCLTRESR